MPADDPKDPAERHDAKPPLFPEDRPACGSGPGPPTSTVQDQAPKRYRQERIAHWDTVALALDRWKGLGGYYHERLTEVYKWLVRPGLRVLELGCGTGDLLAALEPSDGLGVDFSAEMIRRARVRHPPMRFVQSDVHDFQDDQTFDVIILSDLVNDLWDIQAVLRRVARMSTPRTRVIINTYSRLWEQPLALVRRFGLAKPNLRLNWVTVEDLTNLLYLCGFEVMRRWSEFLLPVRLPLLSGLCNRYLVRFAPFRWLALTNFIVARPQPHEPSPGEEPIVSVVVPARNEAGNIEPIVVRTPEMGRRTELIFVEGHSKDNTYEAVQAAISAHPERCAKLFRQPGKGKGDAVRTGFAQAGGDVLMILDADMTVAPEDLPRFYEALRDGKGEFINGVRLVYPMEDRAMRFFNLVGNKFFSRAFSWILGQPVKDTLCGTKVLWKRDYEAIAANRSYFGDFDPFGDFDLLFGAAKLNLKIVDLPIRYRQRTYGTTNIRRWRHGWLLVRMVLVGARRLKFV